ncbi:MAG: MBL fold metallo-hydrolase [Gemmatimonadetes bacterium]|nr:MBL fold metallo-hydrolase [Gemmatimonadota bacterium]
MRVTVLGSGSTGNATLVEAEGVCVLVDAGLSGRDLEQRLHSVGVEPRRLAGILITHDHGDHTRGMGVLARRFGTPLYLTSATQRACNSLLNGKEELRSYTVAHPFRIGPLEIQPFLTAHDAADPVAVTLHHVGPGHKLGIATDLGRPTLAVRHALAGCHLLVLEANHDDAMLWNGPYPWPVKQRISSSHGHLSNRESAQFARELHHYALAGVVLAHLSEHCNDPGLARDVVGRALAAGGYRGPLLVAMQDRPLEPLDVEAMRRRARPEQLSLL